MTDDTFSPLLGSDDDNDERPLPDHEYDNNQTVGAGVMGAGGTATDRGTGELGGQAQGGDDGGDDDSIGLPSGVTAGMPAGGAQSYIPAFSDEAVGTDNDEEEDGGSLPHP